MLHCDFREIYGGGCEFKVFLAVLKMLLLSLSGLPWCLHVTPPAWHHPQTYDPAAVLHVCSLLRPGALLPLSLNRIQEQKQETGRQ